MNMDRERELYDKLVDVLNDKLETGASAQDLAVVLNFLKYNNIQATTKHKGVKDLADKAANATLLPFEDEEELPESYLKRVK